MSYTPSPQEQLQSAGLSDAEIALGYEPGDLSDAEVRDLAKRAGLRWLEPDGEDGGYPGGFDMANLDEVRALIKIVREEPRADELATREAWRETIHKAALTVGGFDCYFLGSSKRLGGDPEMRKHYADWHKEANATVNALMDLRDELES